jgi:uncharacterized OB-fold protein
VAGVSDERPLPDRDSAVDDQFWAAASEGRLLVQECADCERRQFFPREWCQFCGSGAVEWLESEGTGRVHTYTVIRRATELPAFAEDVPYVLAYVELEEGVRLCSNVAGCAPEEVEVGMPVEVTFDHVSADLALPKFRPAEAGGE